MVAVAVADGKKEKRKNDTGENKNRLSSTTCIKELQKIFKDWQSLKGLYQKIQKRFTEFK